MLPAYTEIEKTTKFNLSEICDIVFEGIDHDDYPDYCDAFIASAEYQGREMTEEELDELNFNSDYSLWKREQLDNFLY